ncbi:ActS/PrrB/RegB family redox-sensitive histidine kinase [Kaustia mangrovi]|uniref:histidine kinase n=1 Tax=Kaustia mangrovi TaxID=2593653 RepID=A0A7S8C4S4_9HYPH|nr:ActS/PrrB/RegB family redox-sensitive histidine kinase [Kaustia mangrovi]QPC43397.1 ActS/PrrB/RegB family redox-sensitive histidine kinase [Kaustia mangrovi]
MTAEPVETALARPPGEDENLVDIDPLRPGPGLSRLRLQTLVRLRWLAVAGQTIAVLAVYFGLGFPLPLGPCLGAIALSAWLNIFLGLRWRANLRLKDRYAAMLLGYDIAQLAVLLYLTGGLQNPFAFLFLVPVTVSASSLPVERTIWLSVLALAAASLLSAYHLPLPWDPGEPLALPALYTVGMWTAVVSGTVFAAIYSRQIAEEARRMSAALAATEMVLAREQKLSALDGLAAAAAHELGTPLATIALVAKELKRELPEAEHVKEDLELLTSQAERCRQILSRLANREAEGGDHVFGRLRLKVLIEEAVEPLRGDGGDGEAEPEVTVDARAADGVEGKAAAEPVLPRNPGIRYGLDNLIDNAADFARSAVAVDARWDADMVAVTIRDDGPGFAQEIIDKLGEPYITTRTSPLGVDGSTHEGMGLGLFIAKTLLERSGARITLANRPAPEHGAIVRVEWPRSEIDLSWQ